MKTIRSDINELIEENKKYHAILTSIVADVEAMKHKTGYYGGFEDWWSDNDNQIFIEWPNLSILIDKAKEVLK